MSCIICGEPNPCGGSFCPACDERERRRWEERHQEEQYVEPSVEDLCGAEGHQLYREDDDGPRCYCGQRREFDGALNERLEEV